MVKLTRAVALATSLAAMACGPAAKSPAAAPAPVTVDAAPPAAEVPADYTCLDACTDIAICHEDVYGGDFGGGGECTDACEALTVPDQDAYFACVVMAPDCPRMLEC